LFQCSSKMKKSLIPERQTPIQPVDGVGALDTDEILSGVSISKVVLGLLALLVFVDSFLAPRAASPGRQVSFFLGWMLMTRVWLVAPSRFLLGFCAIVAVACVSANHGFFVTIGILHSFYVYLLSGLLIVFWERVGKVFGLAS
jgi:hypothetical protein